MVSQKENRMKITMSWPGNRKTPKEKRVVHKPKIRWQQLGLKDLSEEPASISMDEIRRQVVVASGRGLGHAVRARALKAKPAPQNVMEQLGKVDGLSLSSPRAGR